MDWKLAVIVSPETSRKRDRGFSADSTGIHGINFYQGFLFTFVSVTLTRLVKLESSAEFYMNKNTNALLVRGAVD